MDFLWEISDKLQPYAGHVSAFAMVVTVAQMLTPSLLINEIRKAKSAEKFPVAPFLGGFVLSVLFVIFGQIISCSTTIKVNLIGVSLNMVSEFQRTHKLTLKHYLHVLSLDLSDAFLHLHACQRQVGCVGQDRTRWSVHCCCRVVYDCEFCYIY